MATQRSEISQNRWGMPEEILQDISQGAEIRRVQWVINNYLDVTLSEIRHYMAPLDDTLAELSYEPYEAPWGMPLPLLWDVTKDAETRRIEWVLANHPDVDPEELIRGGPIRNRILGQLTLQRTMEE